MDFEDTSRSTGSLELFFLHFPIFDFLLFLFSDSLNPTSGQTESGLVVPSIYVNVTHQ